MTISHPEGISDWLRRRISRMRRLMRLRTTAPPRAFFTLIPKRLCSPPFERKKTINCWLERRWPPRYTASYSLRRPRRTARGNPRTGTEDRPAEGLDLREAMTSLPAASRQDLASTYGLHARAEAVRLVATAHFGLKRAFRQRIVSFGRATACRSGPWPAEVSAATLVRRSGLKPKCIVYSSRLERSRNVCAWS